MTEFSNDVYDYAARMEGDRQRDRDTENVVDALEAFVVAKVRDIYSDQIEDAIALSNARDELIQILKGANHA